MVEGGKTVFEVFRGLVTDAAVPAPGVVEGLDVIEGHQSRLGFCARDLAGKTLGLERGHEALGQGVVIGIGGPAHAGGDTFFLEALLEGGAGALDAAVAVMDEAGHWALGLDGALEGGGDKIG